MHLDWQYLRKSKYERNYYEYDACGGHMGGEMKSFASYVV